MILNQSADYLRNTLQRNITSEDIAVLLRPKGFDVKVFNAKKDKVKDVTEYELVTVGSGIQIHRWTKEPEKLLKKFEKELAKKKAALFECCGSTEPLDGKTDKSKSIENARIKYLEEKLPSITFNQSLWDCLEAFTITTGCLGYLENLWMQLSRN